MAPETPIRAAIAVGGVVQGVGFRPFVYNAARRLALVGSVRNDADSVRIEVQGSAEAVDALVRLLRESPPLQARIDRLEVARLALRHDETAFVIGAGSRGSPRPILPADLATCGECLREVQTPGERRHRYPFTNCTNCGPRWSIIEQLPYDRPRTSMAGFAMCADCRAEYENPGDRRFHAQPIACPACGPSLALMDSHGTRLAAGDDALRKAAGAILRGGIVALKGLGGFQLVVDATSQPAVERLRQRKRRPDKPLAVMVASLDAAARLCRVDGEETRWLASHQAPIVLLRRLDAGNAHDDAGPEAPLAPGVAPGNPYLGLMLPYTPLHHLLCEAVARPIVCTSGNLSEEPMALAAEEALERLGTIADLLLVHDRPIVRPVDDSVGRVGPDGFQLLRRARGFAPLPVDLGADGPAILAVGGHLKNTVALSVGRQAVLSQHIGDLDNALGVDVHRRAVDDLISFFRVRPAAVACDLHPDYASTRLAEQLSRLWQAPLIAVQHHHAHAASCMAEHGLTGPVLGFSWDGTGYGPDGTVWGGEVLECCGHEMRRAARLRTFPLPGGDRAVRDPRRSALGVLHECLGDAARPIAGRWFTAGEIDTFWTILARPRMTPRTSSMGRLFDAVAAVCGLSTAVSFEGQAAMGLEFLADPACDRPYPFSIGEATPAVLDWGPMLRAILEDVAAGTPAPNVAGRFHHTLAEMAAAAARRWGGREVVLTGGCFQNALLQRLVRDRLVSEGCVVHLHREVPPGDGGIALGQLAIASQRIRA